MKICDAVDMMGQERTYEFRGTAQLEGGHRFLVREFMRHVSFHGDPYLSTGELLSKKEVHNIRDVGCWNCGAILFDRQNDPNHPRLPEEKICMNCGREQ